MRLALLLLAAALGGCASPPPPPPLSAHPAPVALETVLAKPLYQMTPAEAGRYIQYVHQSEPDLRKRIAAIGRKNIASPTC